MPCCVSRMPKLGCKVRRWFLGAGAKRRTPVHILAEAAPISKAIQKSLGVARRMSGFEADDLSGLVASQAGEIGAESCERVAQSLKWSSSRRPYLVLPSFIASWAKSSLAIHLLK